VESVGNAFAGGRTAGLPGAVLGVDWGGAARPVDGRAARVRELVGALPRERIASRAAGIDGSAELPGDVVEVHGANGGVVQTLADAEFDALGASAFMTLFATGEISRVRARSGLILAPQELGAVAFTLGGRVE